MFVWLGLGFFKFLNYSSLEWCGCGVIVCIEVNILFGVLLIQMLYCYVEFYICRVFWQFLNLLGYLECGMGESRIVLGIG